MDLASHIAHILNLFLRDDPERANFRKFVDPKGEKARAVREMISRYEFPVPVPDEPTAEISPQP